MRLVLTRSREGRAFKSATKASLPSAVHEEDEGIDERSIERLKKRIKKKEPEALIGTW